MMELNMASHEEARKQVFNISQGSLSNIPLKKYQTRKRATERFWFAFWPPLLSFKGTLGRVLLGFCHFDHCALVLG